MFILACYDCGFDVNIGWKMFLPVLIPSPIALVQCGGRSLLSSGVCETCSLAGAAAMHWGICFTSVSIAETQAANP